MCITDMLHICYRCGVCVLGSTGRGVDAGKDVCGVCDGDDASCVDCDGEPFGQRETDLCGDCILPDSPVWNLGLQ